PQLHLLLADILLRKQDYSSAAEQIRTYLKEAPQGQFVSEAKQRLEEIEKLATKPDSKSPSAPEPTSAAPDPQAGPVVPTGLAELKVCLRMEDNSSFVGSANVRVMPNEGYEVLGVPTGLAGETLFEGVAPGTYTVEASAPGFLGVRKQTQVDASATLRTVFLMMKP